MITYTNEKNDIFLIVDNAAIFAKESDSPVIPRKYYSVKTISNNSFVIRASSILISYSQLNNCVTKTMNIDSSVFDNPIVKIYDIASSIIKFKKVKLSEQVLDMLLSEDNEAVELVYELLLINPKELIEHYEE